jgi:hypothetical protein
MMSSVLAVELEQRFVIKQLWKRQRKQNAYIICQELLQVYEAGASDKHLLELWIHEIKLGRESLTHNPGKGRRTVDNVDDLILHQLTGKPLFFGVISCGSPQNWSFRDASPLNPMVRNGSMQPEMGTPCSD